MPRIASPRLAILASNTRDAALPVQNPVMGRLLTAAQVATELFGGTVSSAWVRRQVPRKVVLGHSTVRWYEQDVHTWIASKRDGCAL